MKYLYLIVSIIFIGCSDKSATIEPEKEAVAPVEKVQVASTPTIETPKVVMEESVVLESDPVVVPEEKVTKIIKSDVPSSCAEWSDGCNVCTRLSGTKASCTKNPCTNRVVSCLRWN
jgi:hypothetical protein